MAQRGGASPRTPHLETQHPGREDPGHEPLAHPQVSGPPSRAGDGRGLWAQPQIPNPSPSALGGAGGEQQGSPGSCHDALAAARSSLQTQVRCLEPPCSCGRAVPGSGGPRFWFRPISQKFCHHAEHHAHSRIRITERMAPVQRLLKSVEKPSLATMGAGSGLIRSDRYQGARGAVLIWEYLVAPELLLQTDRAACLRSMCC